MPEKPYIYELTLKVRDYECDLQGIVNNANYQHYLEHARHEFLLSIGLSFSDFHQRGVDLVVSHVEIDYKFPLRSRDTFKVMLFVRKVGIRWVFFQDIYRIDFHEKQNNGQPFGTLCLRSKVVSVAVANGMPKDCKELEEIFVSALPDADLYSPVPNGIFPKRSF